MPTPITRQQAQSLPDVSDANRFALRLGVIPYYAASTQNLTVACFSAVRSGYTNEKFPAELGGHRRNFRGRKVYEDSLQCSFYEVATGEVVRAIDSWSEAVAGSKSGNSLGYQHQYSITAELSCFDTTGKEYARQTYFNLFPSARPDVNHTTESSAAVQVQVTFSFDYFEEITIKQR
jgi:hypothetical protein